MPWLSRVTNVFRSSRVDRSLDEEMAFHIECRIEELVAAGMTKEAARDTAQRQFGNQLRLRELSRDIKLLPWLEDLVKDARHGLWTLRRSPVFASVAILTLALGVGANTAVFTVVHAVLLQPLPFPDADRLVRVFENVPANEAPLGRPIRRPLPADDLVRLQSVTRSLTSVDGFYTLIELRLGQDEDVELGGAQVSRDTMALLGARVVLGRLFDERESRLMEPVVILSHQVWRRHFQSDPNVLGRTVVVDRVFAIGPPRRTATVVGVMAEDFRFPTDQTDFWMPYSLRLSVQQGADGVSNIARLGDGVSIEAATEEVTAILTRLRGGSPDAQPDSTVAPRFDVVGMQEALVSPVRPSLRLLTIAVGLVLLIACANVANLLLARTTSRAREIAVRTALGAGRGRLIRQLMTEALVLSVIGGAVGTALALAGLQFLRGLFAALAPQAMIRQVGVEMGQAAVLPRIDEITIDASVLLFTLTVCVICGVLFGLAPALRYGRQREMDTLRPAASVAPGFGLFRANAVRSVLVVVQVALAVVLLVSGGLLMHGLLRLLTVDKGYEPADVLTFQIRLSRDPASGSEVQRLAEDVTARMKTVPGVREVGYAQSLPMVMMGQAAALRVTPAEELPRRVPGANDPRYYPGLLLVSDGFPSALGMRIVNGRSWSDGAGRRRRQILINEALSRGRFQGASPVGTQVYLPDIDLAPWEIAGVVADVRQRGLNEEPEPAIYVNLAEWPRFRGTPPLYYVVRTQGSRPEVLAGARAIVRQVSPDAMLDNVATMEHLVASSIARPRMQAALLGIFAAVAVILAAIGIYGVMAHAVSQNTREIGVRIALGARRSEILKIVLGRAGVLTGAGLGIGLAGALATTRYLQGMIFGITPLDVPTYVGMATLFIMIAMLASYVPARRATKVDPLVALRFE